MAANTNALREGTIGLSEPATDAAAFDLARLLPRKATGNEKDRKDDKDAARLSSDDGATVWVESGDLLHLPRVAPRFEATRFTIAASASAALHAIALFGFVHFGRPALGDNGADQEIPIEIVIESSALPDTGAAKTPEQTGDTPAKVVDAPQVVAATPPEIALPLQKETADTPPPRPSAPAQPVTSELSSASTSPPRAQEPETALAVTPEAKSGPALTPRPEVRNDEKRQEAERKAEQIARDRHTEQRRAIERARAEERTRLAHKQAERYAAEQAERQAAEREQRREAARRSAARADAERQAQRAEARRLAAIERSAGSGSRPAATPGAHAARTARTNDFDAASYRALVARAVRAAIGSRCSLGAGSRVVIALSIGRSGAISAASISSPSGNSNFDAASLAAVRRAGPFPPLQGRSGVSVPVGVACR
ncbi:MAG: TonB family protein [Rhodoblastus sp.]|nr:TonB family protein [Rhodoblastus sp.]